MAIAVQSRAAKNSIVGEHGGRLKVTLVASPIANKANIQLVKFFAKLVSIPQSRVTILRGEKNKNKIIILDFSFSKISDDSVILKNRIEKLIMGQQAEVKHCNVS